MPQTSPVRYEVRSEVLSEVLPQAVLSEFVGHPTASSAGTLPRAVDSDPRSLTATQLATLKAVLALFVRPASSDLPVRPDAVPVNQTPIAFDYRLALDELESICRTRAGYAFTELPLDLQYAVVNLIFSRDLTTPRIDLALWLEVLRRNPSAASL